MRRRKGAQSRAGKGEGGKGAILNFEGGKGDILHFRWRSIGGVKSDNLKASRTPLLACSDFNFR